jgi:hypothetical protein
MRRSCGADPVLWYGKAGVEHAPPLPQLQPVTEAV